MRLTGLVACRFAGLVKKNGRAASLEGAIYYAAVNLHCFFEFLHIVYSRVQ